VFNCTNKLGVYTDSYDTMQTENILVCSCIEFTAAKY